MVYFSYSLDKVFSIFMLMFFEMFIFLVYILYYFGIKIQNVDIFQRMVFNKRNLYEKKLIKEIYIKKNIYWVIENICNVICIILIILLNVGVIIVL